MASTPRVLVVDTSPKRALALLQLLGAAGYETSHAPSAASAATALESTSTEVVVLSTTDAASLPPLLTAADDAAVLVQVDEWNGAAFATKAVDCEVIPREAPVEVLLSLIERAARRTNVRRELALLRARSGEGASAMLVGRSTAMKHLRELIGRAAASQRTVLVAGEPGVGKDLVARLVHDLSERASRPFVRARCAHTDADVLEDELFGRVASSRSPGRAGLLETVRGGTLVLDECTALSAALRSRIARAIVDRSAMRVGGGVPVQLDVRIVLTASDPDASATRRSNGDLLFGDVSVQPIVIPPLRDRRSDIPLLVHHFRARIAEAQGSAPRALPANVMMSLLAQQWTGNVRELEHWVEREAFGTGEIAHGAGSTQRRTGRSFVLTADAPWTLDQLEREYILHVLGQEDGNQSRASERLGIDRRTLYRKLKQYRDESVDLQEAG